MSSFDDALTSAARASGVKLPGPFVHACAQHFAVLLKWNATHNLTRVVEPDDAARRHYLDCVLPACDAPAPDSCIDVGSGAGFPGLVLALWWPTTRMTLVEPAKKRASFLKVAAHTLGIAQRVRVVTAVDATAALVTSRAVFSPGVRAPLAAALAPGATLWQWSVPNEAAAFAVEMASAGLVAQPPLPYVVSGLDARVVLRAGRPA